jgi:hypothetical protein
MDPTRAAHGRGLRRVPRVEDKEIRSMKSATRLVYTLLVALCFLAASGCRIVGTAAREAGDAAADTAEAAGDAAGTAAEGAADIVEETAKETDDAVDDD